tara:strand:+ start:1425 stop:1847 length:423 start_codon:yes stop_codon:yes gene_type:complete
MNDYMGASVREAQIIQAAQDAATSSQRAAASAGVATSRIDEMREMVDEMQSTNQFTGSIIIQLQTDLNQLSEHILSLETTINESIIQMDTPIIDKYTASVIISTLGAITLCIIVCQLLIFYTGRLEARKERRRVHADQYL